MNNNTWANMMYNLGLMGGKWLGEAAENRAREGLDKANKEAQNVSTQPSGNNSNGNNFNNVNNSLVANNGMPVLSQAGNLIMSDKLMYEHYLNEGHPEIAQKYADHANWVRQNMEVPEPYLQDGANASYADAQAYLNGNKFYQGLANQALQNTPQNAGNVGAVTPSVQQTAPAVQGNAYAMPTTAQAVAGNGYNFAAPSIGQLLNNLGGGYNGNFLMGRRY